VQGSNRAVCAALYGPRSHVMQGALLTVVGAGSDADGSREPCGCAGVERVGAELGGP
jgi:hypothetical protein